MQRKGYVCIFVKQLLAGMCFPFSRRGAVCG